ncbi:hypothetical protein ACFQI9_34055 [Paraburkholderia dipogonis]|uniref:hypothetical protein n=1 Tax=Paraburkholderia dipogonis TaxID=1211383 RepID=UPI0036192742
MIDTGTVLGTFLALQLALPVLHACTYSPIASFVPEQFETRLRYTGSAIGYQVGGLLMSGPVPFVAAALIATYGASWPLALYIMLGGVLSLIAVGAARETYMVDIEDTTEHFESGSDSSDTSGLIRQPATD